MGDAVEIAEYIGAVAATDRVVLLCYSAHAALEEARFGPGIAAAAWWRSGFARCVLSRHEA